MKLLALSNSLVPNEHILKGFEIKALSGEHSNQGGKTTAQLIEETVY